MVRCPNCSMKLVEEHEVIMGEKFRYWRCPMCGEKTELVSKSYMDKVMLRSVTEQ